MKNIYRFGSHVYGTAHEDSDEDFIIVCNEKIISKDINIHYFTPIEFQRLLDQHEIQMIECYFLPKEHILQADFPPFQFEIDKGKLRVSISTITSNSWVKGKKKITVLGDYDKYLAIKSIFHSIRILGLGIQLATHGKIIDFKEYNWLFDDLQKLGKEYDYSALWFKIDDKYRKLFNKLNSDFKLLCPKATIPHQQLKDELIQLFKENQCYSTEIIEKKMIQKLADFIQKR